jgi:hypothetical protein
MTKFKAENTSYKAITDILKTRVLKFINNHLHTFFSLLKEPHLLNVECAKNLPTSSLVVGRVLTGIHFILFDNTDIRRGGVFQIILIKKLPGPYSITIFINLFLSFMMKGFGCHKVVSIQSKGS